jgi:hypothetical protein
MLVEIFLLWSFWFWVLVGLEVTLLFVSTVWEKGWVAWVSLAVFLAALQLLGDVNVLGYVWENPWTILMGLGIYLSGGVPYVFFKWYLFVSDHKRKYLDLRNQWLENQGVQMPVVFDKLSDEIQSGWRKEWKEKHARWGDTEFIPSVRKHKGRIIDWMILWPFSFLWTMLNDPIRRFFRHVYNHISESLQAISHKVFADVANDLVEKPSAQPPTSGEQK